MTKTKNAILFFASAVLVSMAAAEEAITVTPGVNDNTVTFKKPGMVGAAQSQVNRVTVTAIDQARREITVKREDGEEVIVPIGKQVKNFAQIKVGDHVVLRQAQAIAFELKKSANQVRERTEGSDVNVAAPGEKPSISKVNRVRIVADVTNVDLKEKTVTLRGPRGSRTLKVLDPKILAAVKVGDQVEVAYAEGAALSVEEAPAP